MKPPAWLQRTMTWLALAGYAALASGLPLSVDSPTLRRDSPAARRLAAKDRSRPFPCMDKPCGCATAEQCFSSCCCNTPTELLAWAKANRIDPAVIAALARRSAAPMAKATCCATVGKTSCCADAVESFCCESSRSESAEPEPMPISAETVVLRAMLACGGIVAQWFAAAGGLPPPIVECRFPFLCIERLEVVDEFDEQPHFSPAAPPPRV